MVSSFMVSIGFLFLRKSGIMIGTHKELMLTILITTICWVITAYVGPKTDAEALRNFYRKVRPAGPGWAAFRAEYDAAGAPPEEAADNVPMALIGWVFGSIMIWSALFTVGNFLDGRMELALGLGLVFLVSAGVLIAVVRRLWK